MCDRLEFKMYSPFITGENWLYGRTVAYCARLMKQDDYYLECAPGYTIRTAILINGIDIVEIVVDKWKPDYDILKNHDAHFSPEELFKNLTGEREGMRYIIRNGVSASEKEDKQFLYWELNGHSSSGLKKPIRFKFSREQYYEALGHLQQLIGKDIIGESRWIRPLLIERLKTQLCRLKKQLEEERRREEEQAHKKLGLEIEEKLKQAEENGTDVVGAFQLGKLYRDYGDNHNAYLWFSTAATLGKFAVRSNPDDKEQSACDRIKFELYCDGSDYFCTEGTTKIYINDTGILDILDAKIDRWELLSYIDYFDYLYPEELYDRLTENRGFIGGSCLEYKAMPFWEDGSTVRNIMIHTLRGFLDNGSVVVAEKQDEKFVYWNIKFPVSLSFKFAKVQYYYALAKFVKANLF